MMTMDEPNPHKAELKIVNCKLESANLRKTAVQKKPFHPLFAGLL
jgi:hypothetical protein